MNYILLLTLLFSVSLFAVTNEMGSVGYVRVQTSLDDEKENVCFKAPKAGSKYRLGNECETWLELGVFQNVTFENGIVLHNQIRPSFMGANEESVEFLRFEELYSEVSNIFDNSVSFWIGRRYYKRYDSHMSDFFFLNMGGDGLGINNLDLGEVKLSYSFIYDKINPQTIAGDEEIFFQSHDVRFAKELEHGELTLFLNYMHLEGKTFITAQHIGEVDGYALGLIYKETKIFEELFGMKGENIAAVFYGEGVAKGAGAYSPFLQEPLIDAMLISAKSIQDSKTFRFINYNAFEHESFGVMSNLVYEYSDEKEFLNLEKEWFSAGVRPYWFASKNTRLLGEVGYDLVHDKTNDESYALLKATAALEFAFKKGIWERPVLRLYYTQANWTQSAKGLAGTSFYEDKTAGDNIGVQLEYWW